MLLLQVFCVYMHRYQKLLQRWRICLCLYLSLFYFLVFLIPAVKIMPNQVELFDSASYSLAWSSPIYVVVANGLGRNVYMYLY